MSAAVCEGILNIICHMVSSLSFSPDNALCTLGFVLQNKTFGLISYGNKTPVITVGEQKHLPAIASFLTLTSLSQQSLA